MNERLLWIVVLTVLLALVGGCAWNGTFECKWDYQGKVDPAPSIAAAFGHGGEDEAESETD